MRRTLILALAFVLEVNGFGLNFWKLQTKIKQDLRLLHSSGSSDSFVGFESHMIIQPLDHFDPFMKETFGQIYYANSKYWKRPNGPVFLYIGGEGGGLADWIVDYGALAKFAKIHGALIFAIEHRFYGQSINNDGLKLQKLKYLSTQQALADIATFRVQMAKTYNLSERNKWVSFGGSYPGMLAAWVRIKYPHLVHAAVASSAPVRAIVNFQGYIDVVAKSLATELVGGSQKCADRVRAAFKTVDGLIARGNLTKLSIDFLSCEPISSEEDIYQFVSNIANFIMGTVQYNSEGAYMNIHKLCQIMIKKQDAYQNLVALNKAFLKYTVSGCSDNSWQNLIRLLSNDTLDRTRVSMWRQWIYQTCAQFGFYTACDDDDCLFSRYMTLSPNFDVCNTVFNIDTKKIYDQVDFTNSYYGSDDPHGTRILFVNGLIDPWHELSVLKDLSSSELAIVIPDTSHCVDMYHDSIYDPPSVTVARLKINQQIGLWLKESDHDLVSHQNRFSNKGNAGLLQKL